MKINKFKYNRRKQMNIDELENTLNEKFITVYQNILITGEWGSEKLML